MKSALSHVLARPVQKTMLLSMASLCFAVLLGFSALVRIPIPGSPVPVTLQTFTLLIGAGLLGRSGALQMVGWYLVLGLLGAPFFVGGSGWSYLFGATGGYLIGFFFAAAWVGSQSDRVHAWYQQIAIYLLAALMLYVPGLLQLKLVTGASFSQTVAMGLTPFLLGDLLKALAACGGVRATKAWLR